MNEPSPRGLRGLVRLAVATAKGAQEDRLLGLGAEVAFFALLSLPPAMLAIFGTVGYFADGLGPEAVDRIRSEVMFVASTFLAGPALETLGDFIEDLLSEGRASVISVGILLTIWSSSRMTRSTMEALEIAYGQRDIRSALRRRVAALGLTALGILAAVTVLPLIVAGPRLGTAIGQPLGLGELFAATWRVLYWPGVGMLGVVLLTAFYNAAAPLRTPWTRDMPGAVLAAVLWIAGGAGLRVWASIAIEGATTYGPLAAPIVILLWLYVTSLSVLAGAELNAHIEELWPTRAEERPASTDAPEGKEAPAGTRPTAPTEQPSKQAPVATGPLAKFRRSR